MQVRAASTATGAVMKGWMAAAAAGDGHGITCLALPSSTLTLPRASTPVLALLTPLSCCGLLHCPAVFQDADDEYGTLPAIKARLEAWKARQPGAYRDAYVSLSAPALFAPFVRLELLKWRPLHGGDAGEEHAGWPSHAVLCRDVGM